MDINLKNRDDLKEKNIKTEVVKEKDKAEKNHNWKILGIIAMILTVFIAAGTTVGLYPYMEEKAAEFNSRNRRQETEAAGGFGNLTTQVMNFSYVLWHQQKQEENGGILTYSQTFLAGDGTGAADGVSAENMQNAPEILGASNTTADGDAAADTDAVANAVAGDTSEEIHGADSTENTEDTEDIQALREEIKDMIDELGTTWNNLYNQYNDRISYAVMDPQGGYLRSNVNDPQEIFSRTVADNELQFTVHFDENGRLTVSDVKGQESNTSGLIRSIGRFEFYDPLASRLTNSYRRAGLEFNGPKNMTIKFRCQPNKLGSWNEEKPQNAYAYDNYDYQSGHGFITVVIYVSLAVLAAALLIPFIPGMEVVKMKVFSWSFEPLCVIGAGWLLLLLNMEIPLDIVRSFMSGNLQAELAKAGFLPFMVNALAVAANFLFWVVIYGMFYWGITNFRSFFSLGPWRYFKERTWLGRFLRFCKRWVCTGLDLFSQTDWESRSSKIIGKAVIANFVILACISLLWFWGIGALVLYSIILFFLLKKYWGKVQEKYHKLLHCIQEMAEGNLNVKEEEDLGIFEPFKNQLFKVQDGFKKAVEKEVKSERTKTELITNVSHDLKTPLTAIITYVNLLKQENITEEERRSYIQILDQKSMRLKELIEDLFEVSKAANGTVVLHPEEVDVVSLLKQVRFELSDKIEASGIQFHFDLPNERLAASLDGQKTCRIFENLLVNITKYGMKGTRAYIKAEKDGEYVQVTLRNISAEELKISPEELTERFVRGDASRNTEGSGLGLAIARSFTEVQGGTMKIEVEGDLFRVILRWKLKDGSEEPEETIQEGSVQEKLVQEEPEADDLDTSDQ